MPKPSKPVISPGQGLLLLIDHYKKDADKTKLLKKLYLNGAANESERQEIKSLLKDKILAGYQISYEANVINEDPTRRYFETHLSYESLKHGLDKIDFAELATHNDRLMKMLPRGPAASVAHVLKGELRPGDTTLKKEYSDYIAKIKSGKMFEQFSPQDRAKIELIVKSSFLGVFNAWFTRMPLDIYKTGIYADVNKGKKMTKGQETTGNQHLGLMKGHMPLPLNDVARGDEPLPFLKPSDQATFVEHAVWPAMNFDKMVHPFSNSISGTMLCQLRSMAKLRDDGAGTFTVSGEKMEQYGKLFISAMLFGSGGHSLNEFSAPLCLEETRTEFSTTPEFERISLESMFLKGNEEGFDSALKDTISYNTMVLKKQLLHAQIKGEAPVEPTNRALSLIASQSLISSISKQKDSYAEQISSQLLSPLRSGRQKNEIIQAELDKVIDFLKSGDLHSAKTAISSLKDQLESKFGNTNIWGATSESHKLVESIESSINQCYEAKLAVKDKFVSLRQPAPDPTVEVSEEARTRLK